MDEVKIKRYQKKLDYSYAFGVAPTIDLLSNRLDAVVEVLLHPSGIDREDVKKVIELCDEKGIKHRYAESEIEKIGKKENTYVVSIFRKFEEKIEEGQDHILLVNPKDPGNLGTIIRTMVCFGLHDLAIISPAVDIFNPTVLSSAIGAFFKVRIEMFRSLEEYQNMHKNSLNMFVLGEGEAFDKVGYASPYTLVFGNEGEGLSGEILAAGKRVYIGQSSEHDSLNLSVSAGIAIREATKSKFN